jgi:hypothetical protein
VIEDEVVAQLVNIGMTSFQVAVMEAEEYLPKLTLQYEGHDGWNVVAYAGPMSGLADSLGVLTDDPISWLALTIDTYNANVPTPEEAQALAGTLRSLFEAGDPRVTESLQVIIATDDEVRTIALPYERDGIAVNWLEPRTKVSFTEPVAALLQDAVRSSLV